MTQPVIPPHLRNTLNSKAWQLPEPETVSTYQEINHTHGTPGTYILPAGNFFRVNIDFSHGEREFTETYYLCLQDELAPDDGFQNYFMRYFWDEEDGSPPEDDGYAYDDDLWVSETFSSIIQIPGHIMQELVSLGEQRPMIYGVTHYNRWADDRADYNERQGIDE